MSRMGSQRWWHRAPSGAERGRHAALPQTEPQIVGDILIADAPSVTAELDDTDDVAAMDAAAGGEVAVVSEPVEGMGSETGTEAPEPEPAVEPEPEPVSPEPEPAVLPEAAAEPEPEAVASEPEDFPAPEPEPAIDIWVSPVAGSSLVTQAGIERLADVITDTHTLLQGRLESFVVWDRRSTAPIVAYNPHRDMAALFQRIVVQFEETLGHSGFPELRRFFILDLDGDRMVIVMRHEAPLVSALSLSTHGANMGVVMGAAVPNILARIGEVSVVG